MALVTDYATLQSELKAEMDRADDTSSPWTRFIDQAESRLKRDRRVRRLMTTTLNANAEDVALPSGFAELVGLSHNGPTYYHPVVVVAWDQLPEMRVRYGSTTGVPAACAIKQKTTVRFAPVPDQTYTLRLEYYESVTTLGGSVLSNWLLDDHPDIYLAACVVEAMKYFRDGNLSAAYEDMDRRLEELHRDVWRSEAGGTMQRMPANPMA